MTVEKYDRKPYLINDSLKKYMMASIITMAVMNLNGMLDGILMGNILGPSALSAINVSMPVISLISAVGLILFNGAVLMIAKAMGKGEKQKVNNIFSVALLSTIIVGAVLMILSPMISGFLGNMLCVDKTLVELVEKYVWVLILGCVPLMLQNFFSMLVDVLGNPKMVTISMVSSVVINIICDILFVAVLKTDIGGAAAATITGAVVSLIVFIIYLVKKGRDIHFVLRVSGWFGIFANNIVRSIPGVIGTLSMMVLQLICNFFVQMALGANGMFVMSIGYSIISLGNMVANGVGMSYMAIGSLLVAQKDYRGLKMLYRKGMQIVIIVLVVFLVIAFFAPQFLATMFGSHDPVQLQLAGTGIPLISIVLIAFSLVTPLSVVYQVLGRFLNATIISISLIAATAIGFVIAVAVFPSELIWLAFPVSCAITVGVTLLSSALARKGAGNKYSAITLIPRFNEDALIFDKSIPADMSEIPSAMEEVNAFLAELQIGEKENDISHSIEEIMMNVASFAGSKKGQMFDLRIIVEEGEITAVIKDNGSAFDPTKQDESEEAFGLRLARGFCDGMRYSYSFGQNITFLKWDLK